MIFASMLDVISLLFNMFLMYFIAEGTHQIYWDLSVVTVVPTHFQNKKGD